MADHSYSASSSSTWYIDSGALSPMTGARDMLSELSQTEIDVEVVLRDDSVVIAVGHATITFHSESMSPMVLRDVLYVPRLKNNLVSVSMIEDRCLGVSFLDGHVHVFPKTAGPSASYAIRVGCGMMYKLLFQLQHALAHSSGNELWHRRMAHLHHPTLRLLRHMVIGLPELST